MKARELLKTDVKVGTLVEFKDKSKGIIICGYQVKDKCVVNKKAIFLSSPFFGYAIADGFLDHEARIIKKVVLG